MGATHSSVRDMFPNHPHIDSPGGREKVKLKHENGGTLSYGLGNSEDGLKASNPSLYSKLNKEMEE